MLQSPIEQSTPEQIEQVKKVLFSIPWLKILNQQQFAEIQKILPQILPKLLTSKASQSSTKEKESSGSKSEPATKQKITNEQFSQFLSQFSILSMQQNLTDEQFTWLQNFLLQIPAEQLTPDQLYDLGKAFYQIPLEKILTFEQFSQVKSVLARILAKPKVNQFSINRNQTRKIQQQQQISDQQFAYFLSQMSQLGMLRSLTEQQFMWLKNYMLQFPVEQLTPQQLDQFRRVFFQLPLDEILTQKQFSQVQNLLTQISFKLQKSRFIEMSKFSEEMSDEEFAQILAMISQVGIQQRLTEEQLNILLNEFSQFPIQQFTIQLLDQLKAKIEQLPLDQILTPEQSAKIQVVLAPLLQQPRPQGSQFQFKRNLRL